MKKFLFWVYIVIAGFNLNAAIHHASNHQFVWFALDSFFACWMIIACTKMMQSQNKEE